MTIKHIVSYQKSVFTPRPAAYNKSRRAQVTKPGRGQARLGAARQGVERVA